MRDTLELIALFVAWLLPVPYFMYASFIASTASEDAEKARDWIVGLFIAVFVLASLLLGQIFGWG